jgi:hypothetical protein
MVEPEPPQDKQRVGAVPGLHLLPPHVAHVDLRYIANSILQKYYRCLFPLLPR